jgi:hypothetical protein
MKHIKPIRFLKDNQYLIPRARILREVASMKSLLSILLFAITLNDSYANDQRYDWILEQYENKESSGSDAIHDYKTGQIDGEQYLAIIANRTSPKEEDFHPFILIFKGNLKDHTAIAQEDLQYDNVVAYSVEIKENSIYLMHTNAHHGVFDERYQFKKINQSFRMVGAETQSSQLGCYASGEFSPGCDTYDVWSGNSYNFLTSTTICWQETIPLENQQRSKEARDRYQKWHQPKRGVRHQMKFTQMNLPLLEGFDFFEPFLPNSCSFDHKNRLINR